MDNFLRQLGQQFSATFGQHLADYTGRLLIAALALVVGWLLAQWVADRVRASLKQSGLDDRLGGWLSSEKAIAGEEVAGGLSRGVYWALMIGVLGIVLYALGVTPIAEPMNRLMGRMVDFVPSVLMAGLLAVLAWVVANVLRKVVEKALAGAHIDESLGEQAGLKGRKAIPISKTLSGAVYWLVFLCFLPVILEKLQLTSLLPPVQGMLSRMLDFVPTLIKAGLVLGLGWFLARSVQRMVVNFLTTVVPEHFGEQFGMGEAVNAGSLARAVGIVTYVGILVPAFIAALGVLRIDAITQPATHMLDLILTALPKVLLAVGLMIVAFFVGRWVSKMVSELLSGVGFNHILVALGLAKEEPSKGKRTPSEIVGYLAMVVVVWFSANQAFEIVGLQTFAHQMDRFTGFAGNVILGVLIFGVGLYLANLASRVILESESTESWLLAPAAKLAIIFLSGSMALRQTDLAPTTVDTAFALVLGAVAVAVAIAFGIGGKDIAARELDGWIKAIRSKKND